MRRVQICGCFDLVGFRNVARNFIWEAMASISQDYWGDTKEDWGSRGRKSPAASGGGAPVESLGDEVPQKLKVFFVKLHIIFALKYNKQQLLSLESTS